MVNDGNRFQSTHPVRGATVYYNDIDIATGFQSTHPVRGATLRKAYTIMTIIYFNPRTPCGVRLYSVYRVMWGNYNFNPRTPCGVRRDAEAEQGRSC